MRRNLIVISVVLLLILGVDAGIATWRAIPSGGVARSASPYLAVVWVVLAIAQWRRRGGWGVAVVVISLLWLLVALWSLYLGLTAPALPGAKIILTSALHSWLIGVVIPAVLISLNLRLARRAPTENA